MKTYNITNRISANAKREIARILSTHDKYKKAYFFLPGTSANNRRRNERQFAKNNQDVCFQQSGKLITVKMSYEETCKHVYYSLCVDVDGEKANITTIKNLLK